MTIPRLPRIGRKRTNWSQPIRRSSVHSEHSSVERFVPIVVALIGVAGAVLVGWRQQRDTQAIRRLEDQNKERLAQQELASREKQSSAQLDNARGIADENMKLQAFGVLANHLMSEDARVRARAARLLQAFNDRFAKSIAEAISERDESAIVRGEAYATVERLRQQRRASSAASKPSASDSSNKSDKLNSEEVSQATRSLTLTGIEAQVEDTSFSACAIVGDEYRACYKSLDDCTKSLKGVCVPLAGRMISCFDGRCFVDFASCTRLAARGGFLMCSSHFRPFEFVHVDPVKHVVQPESFKE